MFIPVDQNTALRSLRSSDATDIFSTINAQRAYLGKWLPFVDHTKELKDTENFIQSVLNAPIERTELVFTIRSHDKFAGLIGFKDTDKRNKKTEIGYWLSEEQQKKGIMTQSVKMLCKYSYSELNINRIQIKCAVGNIPSRNIPLRLNFQFEGIERQGELLATGVYSDLEIYSLLKSDL